MQRLHFSDKAYSNKLHIPSLSLALVLLISLPSPTSSCKEHEKGSLLKFLDGLSQDGGLTSSWKDGTDCCKWEGIVCSLDGTITGILLASKSLEGPISGSLGNLTELRHLNLSHNSLSGGLPMELVSSRSIAILDISFNQLNGELHSLPSSNPAQPLQVLNISSNLFTGSFPSTIWKAMENLIALNASNNSFTGAMPTGFCKSSPSFTVLELYFNKLSGSIPLELGDCTMLTVLRAGYNLSGTLPDELFNAISLEHLAFPNNDLHGALDGACIINLRNLQTLDLGGNNFRGKIPDSIGQLKRLEMFHLDYNNMSGELPSALSNCTNLITVDLKENNFNGELGKVNFSNLPNLESLDIYFNNFTGTVPESIYSCGNLTALRLSSNNLQGQLSPRIRDVTYLIFLSLQTLSVISQMHFTSLRAAGTLPPCLSRRTSGERSCPRTTDLMVLIIFNFSACKVAHCLGRYLGSARHWTAALASGVRSLAGARSKLRDYGVRPRACCLAPRAGENLRSQSQAPYMPGSRLQSRARRRPPAAAAQVHVPSPLGFSCDGPGT